MVSKARNIATFLGRTDSANPNELRLLHTGELTGVDSATIMSINGVQFFDTLDSIPTSNLLEGQQAFVNESKRLYISNGSGYYNALTVNNAPFWDSVPLDEYTIVDSATPLTIKADPGDSDGIELFINQSFGSDSAQFMATVTNDSSVFTFTPKTKAEIASAVAAGNLTDSNGDFTYTFKWSDGINFVAKAANIIYNTASASGPNNQIAWRNFQRGVFGSTFGNSTSSTTMYFPYNCQVGDQVILVVGGLGWTALNGSAQVTVPDDFSYNGNPATPTYEYQWGYASGQYDYRTDVYINSALSADMKANGLTIQNNEASGGTSYVVFTMMILGGGNTPLFNHAQINYPGNYALNTYYQVASAAPPSGYQFKNGIAEIHTTRYGTRTFTASSPAVSQWWGDVSRSIYYKQVSYRNYQPNQISGANPLQQPYHRFRHDSGTQYSSSSLVIAY